ncbi:hypothetical protein CCZ01_09720 [Helicobacter monodelphidis]|uniref:hypothetical protein n=1 Tax=Helicobacter sp. 15-1451 TaxID=2004995 RepID=UPI000DCD0956|nr:hypothetical protein [Helicobacter sp. 15-1451]RAX56231.1 hypothetical protein CCZ01_09720 [Helicobacter sp. 15-1451]
MKKILFTFLLFTLFAFSSDELNIDTLFKKQIGLRSITSFSLLSTGNEHSYYLYPNIGVNGNTAIWNDTKQAFLQQTFVYTLFPKLDIIVSAGGSYARQEYTTFDTSEFATQNQFGFDSSWIGLSYTGESIADLIPQITIQTAVIQREHSFGGSKNFYFKSQNVQGSLRGYSDPVVYSLYAGFGYNQPRKFNTLKIDYGHSVYIGGDLSLVLSPKITLDMGIEQRFQSEQKINGRKNSEIRSIPTLSTGSTYSLNADTAFAINANFGGSSAAPDAIFGVSLWKKF